ncbi:SGS domain-containing protein [Xylaria sp. FL0933]|nr:SGS domain-containing protein [Xylaria sp. FL0933]
MSSAPALADAGVQAVSAGKYEEGISKLTEALKHRAAPLWHLERSKAYMRTKHFDAALHDAEMALDIAYSRANREQMMDAQLRRSITFYRMGRFADADVCAFWAIRLSKGARAREEDGQEKLVDEHGNYTVELKQVQDEIAAAQKEKKDMNSLASQQNTRTKEARVRDLAITWRIQALTQMEKLPAEHDGRKVHVKDKYPIPSQPSADTSTATAMDHDSDNEGGESVTTNVKSNPTTWEEVWARYHMLYMKHKIRCSFYQSETSLTVDIFLKNLSPEQVDVGADSRAVRIVPTQGASLGSFPGPVVILLFDEIDPEALRFTVKSMKIEMILKKKKAGKWPQLRCYGADIVDNLSMNPNQGPPLSQFQDFVSSLGLKTVSDLALPDAEHDDSAWYVALLEKLRYALAFRSGDRASAPSSSAPPMEKPTPTPDQTSIPAGAKDAPPAYPTSAKNGPKNWDNIEVDDEDALKNSDVNGFFQQIYQNSDADTKRAMMKSFTESNGTALSTSWADAGSKNYKTQPPDGAEAKKW